MVSPVTRCSGLSFFFRMVYHEECSLNIWDALVVPRRIFMCSLDVLNVEGFLNLQERNEYVSASLSGLKGFRLSRGATKGSSGGPKN